MVVRGVVIVTKGGQITADGRRVAESEVRKIMYGKKRSRRLDRLALRALMM